MSYEPGEYPAAWVQIAVRVKRAAHWLCENCGHEHDPRVGYCLTVHHLDEDKWNSCWTNLVALSQRCHLGIQGTYSAGQLALPLPGISQPRWRLVRGLVPGVPRDERWLCSAVRAATSGKCDACCSEPDPDPAERVRLVYLDGNAANWSVHNVAALCLRCLARREVTLPELFCEQSGRAQPGGKRILLSDSLTLVAGPSFGTAGARDPRTGGLQTSHVWDT